MIDLSSFIKVRCGTATEWLTSTYKLGKAELGFDETNRYLKVGDGKTLWANLPVLGGNLGVTSFGGKQGDILLGAGLTMSDNTLTLSTSGDNSVKYVSQTLTDEQKAQARTNIGAGTSNFSGNYNDLTNKLVIVQTTGTSTTSIMSQKATTDAVNGKQDKITSDNKLAASLISGLAAVATSGSYADLSNKPTIPTVNNGTLTLKAGSNSKTFTANQSTNVTFEVTAASLGALTATKSIKTDNTTAQTVSASESTSGSGTINLHKVAKTGTYSDLIGVPTKLSQFTNDSGFTTNKGTVTQVKVNGTTYSPSSGVVDIGTVITAHQSLDGKQDKITSDNKLAASLISGLAAVATSGSYADLSNKPTIPTVNNGTLTLKAGSNSKTFTANQSSAVTFEVTASNLGAVTKVKVNGVTNSPDSNGLVDLGTISGTGTPGITPNISVTATELPAGSAPTATRSGTNENPLITFGIPQGRYFQTMGQFDLDPGGWVEETTISPYTHTQTVTVDLGQTVADNTPIIVSFDDVVLAVGVVLAQAIPSGTMVDLTFYALSVPEGNITGNIGGVI